MLTLSCNRGKRIFIGNDIIITVSDIKGNKVKLQFDAPKEIVILREKVRDRTLKENNS